MRAPALVLSLLLALPLATATILPPSGLPALASAQGAGHGWMSARVHTDGGKFVVEFEALRTTAPDLVVIDVLAENGTSLGFALTGLLYGSQGARAEGVLAGQDVEVDEMTSNGEGAAGLQIVFNDPATVTEPLTGTFSFVMWVGGDAASWDGAVRGGAGLHVLGVDSGPDTMIATASQFRAAANAAAVELGLSAHVVAAGEVSWHAQSHAFGFYEPWLPGAWLATMSGPNGDATCSCRLFDLAGPNATGPGDYTFRLSGASAGIEGPDDVFLTFADARVPGA